MSDVGYLNFKMPFGNRERMTPMGPNLVTPFKQWVLDGGGLIMAGGWLTFSGIYGKGMWGGSPIEDVLPVTMRQGVDDLIDHPDGATVQLTHPEHPILKGIEMPEDRLILGYNLVQPRPEAQVIATSRNDPLMVVGEAGKGRSIAYTTDPTYHLWRKPARLARLRPVVGAHVQVGGRGDLAGNSAGDPARPGPHNRTIPREITR